MPSDAQVAPAVLLAQVITDRTGIPADELSEAVIAYQTKDDKVGTLSFACCRPHGIRLLAYAITVMVDEEPSGEVEHSPG